MIFLDTSALVDSFSGAQRFSPKLREFLSSGDRMAISSLVLFEWLRGPRRREELLAQEQLFPREEVIPFGSTEAAKAADLYQNLKRARGREFDLAIAATAIVRNAALWTLNHQDFADISGLQLV